MVNFATDRRKVNVADYYSIYKDIDTNRVTREIGKYDPLVFSKKICILRELLNREEVRHAFLLIGDNYFSSLAMQYQFDVDRLRYMFSTILKIDLIFKYGRALTIVKVGNFCRTRRIRGGEA